ncbi:hypothetical protein SDC9_120986 [bioreactor metagenome]|uniref:Uncharacterized protein n=1 Tax=bioreactor metagenome TaxID=1076179 RepID=A0A645CAN8_9ZZZZ
MADQADQIAGRNLRPRHQSKPLQNSQIAPEIEQFSFRSIQRIARILVTKGRFHIAAEFQDAIAVGGDGLLNFVQLRFEIIRFPVVPTEPTNQTHHLVWPHFNHESPP